LISTRLGVAATSGRGVKGEVDGPVVAQPAPTNRSVAMRSHRADGCEMLPARRRVERTPEL
jgi:hypothetical protein